MSWKLAQFGAVAFSIVLSGCTVCQNVRRTMKHEPEAFSWKHDRERSTEVYEQWAERVWGEESANCPEMASERDYYLGFRDGFVDYIWAGGNGEPPPVPPRHLWNVMLRSPDGKRRADLWFGGYRHGARAARFGGFRELGTIRTSLVGLDRNSKPMDYPADAVGPHFPDHNEPAPQEQVLPEPPAAQASPSIVIPDSTPASLASHLPSATPPPQEIPAAPIAKPVSRQPAAFEALGLELLPTARQTTDSPRRLELGNRNRPVIRNMKPAHSPRDRHRHDSQQTNDAAVPSPTPVQPAPYGPGNPTTRNNAKASAPKRAGLLVRDIVLDRPRDTGQVVAAAHAQPIATGRNRSAAMPCEMTNPRSTPPAPAADEPSCETSRSTAADSVMAAIHTEPIAATAKPAVQLKAVDGTPSQSPNAVVTIVDTTTEPTLGPLNTAIKTANISSSPKLTILPVADGKLERIVIAGPSPTSVQASPSTQLDLNSGTIRIRTTIDNVERLPVKAAASKE